MSPELPPEQRFITEFDLEDRGRTVPPMSQEYRDLFAKPRMGWQKLVSGVAYASVDYGSVMVAGALMYYVTGDVRWGVLGLVWYTPQAQVVRDTFVREFFSESQKG